MKKNKKILIILLAIICILITLGAYLNSSSFNDTNISSENITVNDSIADITNPDENGTVWLEENGTLTEAKVTESTGNGSASS